MIVYLVSSNTCDYFWYNNNFYFLLSDNCNRAFTILNNKDELGRVDNNTKTLLYKSVFDISKKTIHSLNKNKKSLYDNLYDILFTKILETL